MKNRHFIKVGAILLTALILGFINLPAAQQKQIIPWTPQALTDSFYHLGLDLQGGSQLDYKIDLTQVPEADQQSIVNGVLDVINNRVNGLGVAEPNIYLSNEADGQHLIVELAGIKDINQAKEVVGKTIQLDFKEERTTPDTTTDATVKSQIQSFLASVSKGEDFSVAAQEQQLANPGKVTDTTVDYQYKDQVPASLADELFNKLSPGEVSTTPISAAGEYTVDASGNMSQSTGYYVVKLIDRKSQERTIQTKAQVSVSHILIAYQGATRAAATVTRTKDQAQALANQILQQLQGGANFADLAKKYSDDASNANTGGVLTQPVTGDGTYAQSFETAALALQKPGDLSPVTESEFGFHIIKADSVQAASSSTQVEPEVSYEKVFFDATPDQWQETGLTGKQFVHADVEFDQLYQPYVSIQFNDDGSKLFQEITQRNIGKPVAIFVGGQMISAPTVKEEITGGHAQITGNYTVDTAGQLAQDLNTGAIPAPIVLASQETIGATLGQDALTKSLGAGIIGFLLVALFMIILYRLPGLLAVIALFVYSMIMLFLIKMALPLWLSIGVSLIIFVVVVMKVINSRDSGPEKAIGLILSCFVLFFLSFILSTAIVMTLAGIAGLILSIGMAVDANILIFERVKEELRDGRTLSSAIETGFDRAWNSIRDSNFSSLITCGILFYFGSSIIQGFAFNLAAGILVSMLTAITVTKTLLNALVNTKLAEKSWLFGTPKKKETKLLPIIQKRKITYYISGTLLVLAILGIPFFGLKFGLDFTGGTQMQFKFDNAVTPPQIIQALDAAQNTINKAGGVSAYTGNTQQSVAAVTPTQQFGDISVQNLPVGGSDNTDSQQNDTNAQISNSTDDIVNIGTPEIIPSGDNTFQITVAHISSDAHDAMIPLLQKSLGNFTETSFSTVGPTVGETQSYRALFALILASIMIVLYIAFAFRKVPRHVGQWRFGVSAIIALLHDLGIMLGIYVYFGVFFGVQIDTLFITAMLTVMGFSVHDTIVVFDRIREKLKYQKREETFAEVANQAVNETIARSINTSFSVFLTLLALAIFGADSIRFFVLALMVGIVAGTYSSIFVATPILVDWYEMSKKDKNKK